MRLTEKQQKKLMLRIKSIALEKFENVMDADNVTFTLDDENTLHAEVGGDAEEEANEIAEEVIEILKEFELEDEDKDPDPEMDRAKDLLLEEIAERQKLLYLLNRK